jgi:hypothetical protein
MFAMSGKNNEVKSEVFTIIATKGCIFWSGVMTQKTEFYAEVSCGNAVEIVSCFELLLTIKFRSNEPRPPRLSLQNKGTNCVQCALIFLCIYGE